MKWEYQVLQLTMPTVKFEKPIETQLDTQGQQGWELVSLIRIENQHVAIFKKPIPALSCPITHL